MEGPHGPQSQVDEGDCAIKVSMRCSDACYLPFIPAVVCARTRSARDRLRVDGVDGDEQRWRVGRV